MGTLENIADALGVGGVADTSLTSSDAFGRLRISAVETLFDSKQIFSNEPLFWDDAQVSGGSTTSQWTQATASTLLGVAASTAGRRVRQTFMHFNYQPGKSHLIVMTGNLRTSGGGTGVTTRLGYFNDANGLFFEVAEGVAAVVKRSSVSGSPVETRVVQSAWNLDRLDGTGPSNLTLDWTKNQIFLIDFEWLGVGLVRFGVRVNGTTVYLHQIAHANVVSTVYMSTPNLPIRYEIINSGTGVASTMTHGCASVMSEGGQTPLGTFQYHSTGATHLDANTDETLYAILGIRLKAAALGGVIDLLTLSFLALTADNFEWVVLFNPTVAGTFTYTDKANSLVQTAVGATANVVTEPSGHPIDGGHVDASSDVRITIANALRLGSIIAGTPQTLVLAVRPHSPNLDVHASLTWRERF